jgi:RNA recognition motif-containing protein
MLRIHAGHPPPDLTEKGFTDLFAEHGRVRSMDLAGDIFSSRCHGFGFIEMEGHEARVAISALNGLTLRGKLSSCHEERPRRRNGGSTRC